MKRTRILYCTNAMWVGGTEQQLANLIKRLDRSRFEPAICILKPGGMDLGVLDCPVLELSVTSLRSAHALRSLLRLRRFIREHRIEVLHTFFADPSLLGYLASLGTSVRVRVGSIRDLGFWRTRAQEAMVRRLYPFFDGFISNSKVGAATAHAMDGIPLEKIRVIPNGVDSPPVLGTGASREQPVVGIVSNLHEPLKRVDLFLEAAHLVHRQRPDARFVIVGDGPLRAGLEAQAAALGIRHRVDFVGCVPDAQMLARSFDIGVSCSDSEGLSNAIIEFMVSGVPTVARNVGGNPELVVHNETGFLVDGNQPSAIAEPILRLLSDPSTRRRMGARAREVAIAEYSWESCVRHHEEYYSGLMNQNDLPSRAATRALMTVPRVFGRRFPRQRETASAAEPPK